MGARASQITSLTIVNSTVYSGADQRKYQISASLVFERGIHRWTANSPHKWPVARKVFPFDDVIMQWSSLTHSISCNSCEVANQYVSCSSPDQNPLYCLSNIVVRMSNETRCLRLLLFTSAKRSLLSFVVITVTHKGWETRKMFPFDDIIMKEAARLFLI